MISYAKLRDGSWGIRSTEKVTIGQTVTVTKKDGSLAVEKIAKIVWEGNGVWLCAVEPKSHASRKGGSGNVCAECGRRGQLVRDLEDGLWKHYRCCDIPPD